jgi:hypothetical protein
MVDHGGHDRMKIPVASTPATGHLNPLLAVARILIAEGHDLRDILAVVPELKNIHPAPEWPRVAMERVFVDTVRPQHEGLLQNLPVDVIVADDMYFGALPMLLGALPSRPLFTKLPEEAGTVVLYGEGDHFSAGADLSTFVNVSPAAPKVVHVSGKGEQQ